MASTRERTPPAFASKPTSRSGCAPVNGLQMYYEITGTGDPIVFIHPAMGFGGLARLSALAQRHTLITLDLQGHGRTADDPDRPLSIERYADDVVALLDHLQISRVDVFGESYGGNAATLMAIRYPERVRRIATYSATFGPAERAHNPAMLRFDEPPTPDSAATRFQRDNYEKVAPVPDAWPRLWEKVSKIHWSGVSRSELASIKAPMLIMVGDRDFVRVEHAVETFRSIPGSELAVIPDAGHFALYSEADRVIPTVLHFLDKPETRPPVAHAGLGYQPGRSR